MKFSSPSLFSMLLSTSILFNPMVHADQTELEKKFAVGAITIVSGDVGDDATLPSFMFSTGISVEPEDTDTGAAPSRLPIIDVYSYSVATDFSDENLKDTCFSHGTDNLIGTISSSGVTSDFFSGTATLMAPSEASPVDNTFSITSFKDLIDDDDNGFFGIKVENSPDATVESGTKIARIRLCFRASLLTEDHTVDSTTDTPLGKIANYRELAVEYTITLDGEDIATTDPVLADAVDPAEVKPQAEYEARAFFCNPDAANGDIAAFDGSALTSGTEIDQNDDIRVCFAPPSDQTDFFTVDSVLDVTLHADAVIAADTGAVTSTLSKQVFLSTADSNPFAEVDCTPEDRCHVQIFPVAEFFPDFSNDADDYDLTAIGSVILGIGAIDPARRGLQATKKQVTVNFSLTKKAGGSRGLQETAEASFETENPLALTITRSESNNSRILVSVIPAVVGALALCCFGFLICKKRKNDDDDKEEQRKAVAVLPSQTTTSEGGSITSTHPSEGGEIQEA